MVAYSGGVDSHVLLHICAQLRPQLKDITFQAVYIDHGLHENSSRWSAHCKQVALKLDIEYISQKVFAKDINGDGPEQAARLARYKALSKYIDKQTLLLTAQHQDDQAETLLLQLLRGSGVKGLSSMPLLSKFEGGYLLRPFLDCSKQSISDYAATHTLSWVEDPSNLDVSYDRNFLRQSVIPLIKQRWPAFSKTTSRSAAHCAEASTILTDLASTLLQDALVDKLELSLLVTLNDETQRLVIRQWLADHKIRMPSEKVLEEIQRLVVQPLVKSACIKLGDQQLRLFDACFFIVTQEIEAFPFIDWIGNKVMLPACMGDLSFIEVTGAGIDKELWESSRISIRCRQGGESLKVAGRLGHKKLKKLLYENKIFPWVRNIIPLIYLDGQLVAVADLWVDENYLVMEGEKGYLPQWNHPDLRIQ